MDEWTRKITKGLVVVCLIGAGISEIFLYFRPEWEIVNSLVDRSNTFLLLVLGIFVVLFRIQILMFDINDKTEVK
jgi:hypothetical protein